MLAWIGAAIGLASAVASGVSAIMGNQKQRQAEKAAERYANELDRLKEENPFKTVQAPDISSLQSQQAAREGMQAQQALQGMGPEGAAQIANLHQAGIQNQADIAQKQGMVNYERDVTEATAQKEINAREVTRKSDMLTSRIEGAQTAAANANDQKNAGISGIFSGLSTAYESQIGNEAGVYKNRG